MNEHLKVILHNQYLMLDNLLQNVSKNSLILKSQNGKWNVFENIAHLGRYNEIFFDRMQQIQNKNNPSFDRYVADDEPGFIEWRSRSFNLVFADYHSLKEKIIQFFDSLSDEQLKRVGTHAKFGELTTEEWLQFYLLHEAHHLFTIFKLLHTKDD